MPPFAPSNTTHSGGVGGREGGPYFNLSGSGTSSTVASGPPSPATAPIPLGGSSAPDQHKLKQENSNVSLSINYLPKKFSSSMLNPVGSGARRRKVAAAMNGKKGAGGLQIPKMGGGVEAFKSGEARMASEGDDDYDGVNIKRGSWFPGAEPGSRKMRWTRFKWTLFVANLVVWHTPPPFCLIRNTHYYY